MNKKPNLSDLTNEQLRILRQHIERLRFVPEKYKTGRLKQIDAEIQNRQNEIKEK